MRRDAAITQILISIRRNTNLNSITFDTLPDILTAEDLQELLRLSKSGTYNLMNRSDFPTLSVGGCKRVLKTDLFRWMDEHKRTPA